MKVMNKEKFISLKEEKKDFSFIAEYRGDEITPITIFNSLTGKSKFILESGCKSDSFGRYSFMGEEPEGNIRGSSKEILDELKKINSKNFNLESNPFPFKGGAIGYIGYEAIGFFEEKLSFRNIDELNIPIVNFNIYKSYISFDHFTHKVYIVENIFQDDIRSYEEIVEVCKGKYEKIKLRNFNEYVSSEDNIEFHSNFSKEEFMNIVEKCREYIKAGDIFQVVPSQRMKCKTNKNPLEIYRRLRESNPSPYMFYIEFEDFSVVGASPEILVSLQDGIVTTNPIAGSARRGGTKREDEEIENALVEDKKEIAEHVMLVDLGRNDIGKVSEIGSVEVKDFMKVEKYSHIMHITTKVQGKLLKGKNALDALAACLPAGTLSGAPKFRAIEIIEEVETVKRGIYGGAIGYFSIDGNMDMAIAIRTVVLKEGTAYLQAGSGIVYDSNSEFEYEESLNKLGAIREALQ